jgi:hypothetical protein
MNNKLNLDGTANQDSRANENQPTEPTSSRNHVNQEQTNQETDNYLTNNNMDTETTTEHNRDNNSLQETTDTDQKFDNRSRHDNNNNGTDNNNNGNNRHKINRTKCVQQILLQTKLMKHGERAYINYHLQLLGSTSRILMDSIFNHISLSGRHTSSL